MHVELNYGKGTLPVELSDTLGVTVIRKPVMPVHSDPAASVAKARRTGSLDPRRGGLSGAGPGVRRPWHVVVGQRLTRRNRDARP